MTAHPMNSTERDLPEDKLRERLLGIVAGPNPALTPRQRAAIRDAADALASIRAERDAAVAALKRETEECAKVVENALRADYRAKTGQERGNSEAEVFLARAIRARAIAGEQNK